MYDAHIHLDQYEPAETQQLFDDLRVEGMIAVSTRLASCLQTQRLALQYPAQVYPAYGFHPEQPLPDSLDDLFDFIGQNPPEMVAIGEVGLPYYTAQTHAQQGKPFRRQPYIDLLERFIKLAVKLSKPVALHAVYEDAATVCGLLEKHRCRQAHFHWYKGDPATTHRLIRNGYYVSVTPDIFYKARTQALVQAYPLSHLMVETDGPWPHEGAFAGQMTHPNRVWQVAAEIARLKDLAYDVVCKQLALNTRRCYQL